MTKEKQICYLALIIILGLLLRLYVNNDKFLHEWDERYHALVAKNFLKHPLKPTLYDNPVLSYDHKDWTLNNIWLSKPPLALWFIALSIKIFGTNEFAVRLPSLIFSSLAIALTYVIGNSLLHPRIGLIAAFLQAIHGMLIESSGGRMSSDHVDILLLLLFESAIFCGIMYFRDKKNWSLAAIGILTGLSFLTKWIVCILIILIWITMNMLLKQPWKGILKSTSIILWYSIIIALPWIIYILNRFPIESTWIFEAILIPIKEPIQGHHGNAFYYINKVRIIFGELIYLPMIWLIYKGCKEKKFTLIVISTWLFVPLVIFSLMSTKRTTYILVSAPSFFLLTAIFLNYLNAYKNKFFFTKPFIYVIMFLLMALPIRYSIERLKVFTARDRTPEWALNLKSFQMKIGDAPEVIIFNEPHYIEAMFYTNCIAYPFSPQKYLLDSLKMRGFTLFYCTKDGYTEL